MFEKLQTGEKIHDAPVQPRTCSHPIYARMLTGVCQAIRIFSPCFFHVFISYMDLIHTDVKKAAFVWGLVCMGDHWGKPLAGKELKPTGYGDYVIEK